MVDRSGEMQLLHSIAYVQIVSVHGLPPLHLTDAGVMANAIHYRNTELANLKEVNVPPHKSDTMKRAFIYHDNVIWNNLPSEMKMAENLNQFKYNYKTTILHPIFGAM